MKSFKRVRFMDKKEAYKALVKGNIIYYVALGELFTWEMDYPFPNKVRKFFNINGSKIEYKDNTPDGECLIVKH